MCMCGELNLSYVCSRHAYTSDDWRHERPETEAEREERLTQEAQTLVVHDRNATA